MGRSPPTTRSLSPCDGRTGSLGHFFSRPSTESKLSDVACPKKSQRGSCSSKERERDPGFLAKKLFVEFSLRERPTRIMSDRVRCEIAESRDAPESAKIEALPASGLDSIDWASLNRPPKVDFYLVATTGRAHPQPCPDPKGIWKKTRRSYHYAVAGSTPGVDNFQQQHQRNWRAPGANFAPWQPEPRHATWFSPTFASGAGQKSQEWSIAAEDAPIPSVVPAALTLAWSREEIPTLVEQAERLSTLGDGCYACGCLSHSQNNCPLRKCGRCSSYGHSEKACHSLLDPRPRASAPSSNYAASARNPARAERTEDRFGARSWGEGGGGSSSDGRRRTEQRDWPGSRGGSHQDRDSPYSGGSKPRWGSSSGHHSSYSNRYPDSTNGRQGRSNSENWRGSRVPEPCQ